MQKSKCAVMASGGMDSTVLVYYLIKQGFDVHLIYINYGQHFIRTELGALRKNMPNQLIESLKIIDISSVYSESDSALIKKYDLWKDNISEQKMHVPYRSLVMISVSMAYAQTIGCDYLYAGFIDSNFVKEIDCSSEFFEKLEAVNDLYKSVVFKMPFREYSKFDIVKLGLEIEAPIIYSFSCQISSDVPCGACPNCIDRNNAIEKYWKEVEAEI